MPKELQEWLHQKKELALEQLFTVAHEGDIRINYEGKPQIYIQRKWIGTDEMA